MDKVTSSRLRAGAIDLATMLPCPPPPAPGTQKEPELRAQAAFPPSPSTCVSGKRDLDVGFLEEKSSCKTHLRQSTCLKCKLTEKPWAGLRPPPSNACGGNPVLVPLRM